MATHKITEKNQTKSMKKIKIKRTQDFFHLKLIIDEKRKN